ncbi:hypothetical protein ABIC83_002927 [Roseateles asaccharophilus]|uniref:N-acyl amino acid synthase FeeM domain-containing protein n=1 Tax=Roseateles asaccharophilus TaxID=582607 RepID=UPI003835D5D7
MAPHLQSVTDPHAPLRIVSRSLPVSTIEDLTIRLPDSLWSSSLYQACVKRGHDAPHLKMTRNPDGVFLVRAELPNGDLLGTCTVHLGRGRTLPCQVDFDEDVQRYRQANETVAEVEFMRTPVEDETLCKFVRASLFHLAVIWVRRIHEVERLFVVTRDRDMQSTGIEFGLRAIAKRATSGGGGKNLLQAPLIYITRQIEMTGGQAVDAPIGALYPYCFSQAEEEGILQRLLAASVAPSNRAGVFERQAA